MSEIHWNSLFTLYREPEQYIHITLSGWQRLIEVLRHHQLLARFAQRFRDSGHFEDLPKYTQHHMINAELLVAKMNFQVHFEAKELKASLHKYSQYVVFLKGAAYSLSGNKIGAARTYGDIDVLVERNAISAAEKYLCLTGWISEPLTDYDQNYYRRWTHEVPPLRHGNRGTNLDLHHNLVPPVSGRAFDMGLFAGQIRETVDGFQIFSEAAMTLHCLVHLLFNEDFKHGFRDLFDLHLLMAEAQEVGYWDTLLDLAEKSRFDYELYIACYFCRRYLNTPVDEKTYELLQRRFGALSYLTKFVFSKVLAPNHPYAKPKGAGFAHFMAYIRGHFQKMPLHILAYHLLSKSVVLGIQSVFGQHVFEKDEVQKNLK